jgi:hypothetical protein
LAGKKSDTGKEEFKFKFNMGFHSSLNKSPYSPGSLSGEKILFKSGPLSLKEGGNIPTFTYN